MRRAAAIFIALVLGACASNRYVPAGAGEDVEAAHVVTIAPDLQGDVEVVRHSVDRTPDGRLSIQLVLASHRDDDIPIMLRTNFLDEHQRVVGESDWRQVFLRGGTTTVYDAQSLDARPVAYTVAIRPVNLDRKD